MNILDLNKLKEIYMSLKEDSNKQVREILNSDSVYFNNLLKKLEEKCGDSQMIEIGHAFGGGDNGHGYYQVHLMFNLGHLNNEKDIVYLVEKYVPAPDCGHEWEVKEFSEVTECNFTKTTLLLMYMNVFATYCSCLNELERLAQRDYETCVKTVEAGGISFV